MKGCEDCESYCEEIVKLKETIKELDARVAELEQFRSSNHKICG